MVGKSGGEGGEGAWCTISTRAARRERQQLHEVQVEAKCCTWQGVKDISTHLSAAN